MKLCSTCKKSKILTDFHNNKNCKDGKSSRCKECASYAAKLHNENNYERLIDLKRHRRKNPAYSMYEAAKTRARKNNIEFTIKMSDIIVPDFCPILGLALEKNPNRHGPNSPSLDRIDINKGYVIGNIQVISHKANAMKNNATYAELILFAEWIERNIING